MNRLMLRSGCTFIVWLLLHAVHTSTSIKASPAARSEDESLIEQENAPTENVVRMERGITGSLIFTHRGLPLQVKNQLDVDAPLLVRLRVLVRLRKSDQADQYEARFIGNKEGLFDVRDTLEHADGSAADELPAMKVSIISTLPPDARSDLFEAADFRPNLTGGYRVVLLAACLVWLVIPLVVYTIRAVRRPAIVAAPPSPLPVTLADQLRPLIEAAANRGLSTPEKGRLELLLVHYWRERAELPKLSMASSIQRLRAHPEAGPLLNAVENWLHRAASVTASDSEQSAEVILNLLKPYQFALALDPEHAQVSKGSP